MWDVLEHLDDPMAALQACRKVLHDDGVLALSTVDIGSLYARLLGAGWPWLMKMHIYYFDRAVIRKYLERAGFDVLTIRTYKHIVSVDYLIYKLESINPPLHSMTKYLKKILLLNKNLYLGIAFGDFMEVYARKRN